MAEPFLHGVEIVQVATKWPPIETMKSSVIGLIGTAPYADPVKYPLNTPVLMRGNRYQSADFDNTGTLKDALDAIYDHIGAWIVVVRVAEGQTLDQTLANIVSSYRARTGCDCHHCRCRRWRQGAGGDHRLRHHPASS